MKLSHIMASAILFTLSLSHANASVIRFSGSDNGATSFVRMADGVSATFDNATPSNFSFSAFFLNLGPGGVAGSSTQFDITFDTDVLLENVVAGGFGTSSGAFTLIGPGVNSFNSSVTPGVNTLTGGPLSLLANNAYTFSNITGSIRLSGLTFSEQVDDIPVPSSLVLFTALFGLVRWRKGKEFSA